MRNRIILMGGGTETLEFFSLQMDKAFRKMGYETYIFDLCHEEESSAGLHKFVINQEDRCVLITINFDGIHYETSLFDPDGSYFWNVHHIPCINISVDHPFFYHDVLAIHPENFYEVSIDRYHDNYMKRFYPEIKRGPFLPLAGSRYCEEDAYVNFLDGKSLNYTKTEDVLKQPLTPIADRPIDIVFTGNYTPESMFEDSINRNGKEYADFYMDIINDLIHNPDRADDVVIEEYLRKELPDMSDENLRDTIPYMIFIDTYIRCYFRGRAVAVLADSGHKVRCIGKGWERLQCKHPENITAETTHLSAGCLYKISQSKLSLNVMPWFKGGAHDRVFNSMLNGAVCVTDHSEYLDEILKDGENAVFYDLKTIGNLPDIVDLYLKDNDKMQYIQEEAYSFATRNHTWENRARLLCDGLLNKL